MSINLEFLGGTGLEMWEMKGLVVSVVLGGLVGLERAFNAKPAGLRTNTLVCLGAAAFTMMSKHLLGENGAEVSRVIAGVVTGVGFLGAGALIHEGSGVHGLTTAASIWLVASIGIACGVGLYMLAAFVTLLALLVLVGFSPLTKMIRKKVQQRGASNSGYHRRSTDEE